MKAKMELAATAAGFIETGAVEDYHDAHAKHLNDKLSKDGDGFYSCPACRTNPLTHKMRYNVVLHVRRAVARAAAVTAQK